MSHNPEWDPVLQMIDQFYRENYPEYIPNKHGELFPIKGRKLRCLIKGIAQIIFPDSKDLETFLKEQGSYDLHEDLLEIWIDNETVFIR